MDQCTKTQNFLERVLARHCQTNSRERTDVFHQMLSPSKDQGRQRPLWIMRIRIFGRYSPFVRRPQHSLPFCWQDVCPYTSCRITSPRTSGRTPYDLPARTRTGRAVIKVKDNRKFRYHNPRPSERGLYRGKPSTST